jgi:hypothetical protein
VWTGPLCRTPFDLAPGFTQVFRRSLLLLSDLREATVDYWGPGAPLAHDQWIYILASSLGKVCYLSETLADYRQHENNLLACAVQQSRLAGWHEGAPDEIERLWPSGNRLRCHRPRFGCSDGVSHRRGAARRAALAAERYRELAEAYGDRRQAHGAASLMARAAAWTRLWRRGRYRPGGSFYFAGHAAARDLCTGCALPGCDIHQQACPGTIVH